MLCVKIVDNSELDLPAAITKKIVIQGEHQILRYENIETAYAHAETSHRIDHTKKDAHFPLEYILKE